MSTMSLLQLLLLATMLMGLSRSVAACGATSELAACLPAAEADVQPTTECCTVLSTYVSSDDTGGDCLCQAASSSAFNASGAAVEYAVTIPEKCNLTFTAGTQCNGKLARRTYPRFTF